MSMTHMSMPAPPPVRDGDHNNRAATSSDVMVGRRIKALRRKQRLTQKQVAQKIGVTAPQLHRYEVGSTRVAASRLLAIATVFGVHPADFMNDAPPPPAPQTLPTSPDTQDLVTLVEMFSSIGDHRRRLALVAFARSMAARAPTSVEATVMP
ncbi:helix-turn-helix domain-containing protein [Roseococcus sp.]|uniref:helix-turn-helix domain-containing protein n=1 Tax=Roseococcus sp. TaxID=2109646 RepID=UPI003BAAED4F